MAQEVWFYWLVLCEFSVLTIFGAVYGARLLWWKCKSMLYNQDGQMLSVERLPPFPALVGSGSLKLLQDRVPLPPPSTTPRLRWLPSLRHAHPSHSCTISAIRTQRHPATPGQPGPPCFSHPPSCQTALTGPPRLWKPLWSIFLISLRRRDNMQPVRPAFHWVGKEPELLIISRKLTSSRHRGSHVRALFHHPVPDWASEPSKANGHETDGASNSDKAEHPWRESQLVRSWAASQRPGKRSPHPLSLFQRCRLGRPATCFLSPPPLPTLPFSASTILHTGTIIQSVLAIPNSTVKAPS